MRRLLIVIVGLIMVSDMSGKIELEDFDRYWGELGEPQAVEEKLLELVPQAEALEDKSIYLQMLSQVALAEALQGKFDEAHGTLDKAEGLLKPEYDLACVRILLERGRVFQQAGDVEKARDFFEKSYRLSMKRGYDAHAINAAHMVAIVEPRLEDKIRWNEIGLDIGNRTEEVIGKTWLGSLYNNLGRDYMEAKEFEAALENFKKALEIEKEGGYVPRIRIAEYSIANAMRELGSLEEAEEILLGLEKEYESDARSGKLGVPEGMFRLLRGYVYEELSLLYGGKTKHYAKLAYEDLSGDDMFKKTEAKRLERLRELME